MPIDITHRSTSHRSSRSSRSSGDILMAASQLSDRLWVHASGDCMKPLFADGARLHVRRKALYLVGDVIASVHSDGQARVHRCIGYRWQGAQVMPVTQADTSCVPDLPVIHILGAVCGGECAPAVCRVPWTMRLRAGRQYALWMLRRSRRLLARNLWHPRPSADSHDDARWRDAA